MTRVSPGRSLLRRLGIASLFALGALSAATGCARGPDVSASGLSLQRVVIYRNGVAYFERSGVVRADRLTMRVRKDQINDLLKSLTVIDRRSGQTVSISIPLDPKAWQDAALSMLMPGRGELAEVLDALRGTDVAVDTDSRHVSGRIVLIDEDSLRQIK